MKNSQWKLARTPMQGWPVDGDFEWHEGLIPEPEEGQMLTRTLYLSLDPYQWGRRRSGVESPGEVCHGRTVSQVVRSRIPDYSEGDFVFNTNGWQAYGLTGRDISIFNYMKPRKLDPALAPVSTAIGVMGMLGLTAYSGLVVQCQPRKAETVVVSAASGGVGQIAGQLAKIYGCRVVGIAGKSEKCNFVKDVLGFDECVSHLSDSLVDDLRRACPDGIDIYFENVGGKVFEAVLPLLNKQSRITLCGMISQYGNAAGVDSRKLWEAAGQPWFERQSTQVHGLFVGNYVDSHESEFLLKMADWIAAGEVKYKEDLWQGLISAPEAFSAMLQGNNFGKTMVAVGEDPSLDGRLKQARAGFSTI